MLRKSLVLGLTTVFLLGVGCASKQENPSGESMSQTENKEVELKIEELTPGTGASPKSGDRVTVHYTGWLASDWAGDEGIVAKGDKFDSSVDRGQPFVFTIGVGQVIKGWDQGVMTMKEGGKSRLIIPPELGYGSRATGPIPANSTLIFDVELIKVEH